MRLARDVGDEIEDASERLLHAIEDLEQVAQAVTPDEAARTFDEATLQMFWQRWPHVSTWAGTVWRQLNADLAEPATPVEESEAIDVGGEGG